MDKKELFVLASYVKISSYRYAVLTVLSETDVMIPTQIASASDILINHISKVLSELKDKDLVVCLNEDARKGRLYCLTDKGKDVMDIIKKGLV